MGGSVVTLGGRRGGRVVGGTTAKCQFSRVLKRDHHAFDEQEGEKTYPVYVGKGSRFMPVWSSTLAVLPAALPAVGIP